MKTVNTPATRITSMPPEIIPAVPPDAAEEEFEKRLREERAERLRRDGPDPAPAAVLGIRTRNPDEPIVVVRR